MSMISMRTVLLLLVSPIVGGAAGGTAVPHTAVPFRGEWRQIDLTGFRSWDDGRCYMQLFQERVYNLQPFSMNDHEILGTYVSINHGPFLRNEGDCSLEGEQEPQLLSATTRVWQINGKIEPESGDARLEATYQSCLNLDCDNKELSREGFTTRLRRIDDTRMLDTRSSAGGDDGLVFLRADEL